MHAGKTERDKRLEVQIQGFFPRTIVIGQGTPPPPQDYGGKKTLFVVSGDCRGRRFAKANRAPTFGPAPPRGEASAEPVPLPLIFAVRDLTRLPSVGLLEKQCRVRQHVQVLFCCRSLHCRCTMTFTRETDDDDWAGTISVLGNSYPFTIRACYEPEELDAIALRAKEYLESHWQGLLDQLTADLLPMHNGEWRDQDEPLLSETDFRNALGTPDTNVWEEESIMMLFSDGGLFGGHYIEVFIESPENGRDISVGIVG
jgi:hypothetical protein